MDSRTRAAADCAQLERAFVVVVAQGVEHVETGPDLAVQEVGLGEADNRFWRFWARVKRSRRSWPLPSRLRSRSEISPSAPSVVETPAPMVSSPVEVSSWTSTWMTVLSGSLPGTLLTSTL